MRQVADLRNPPMSEYYTGSGYCQNCAHIFNVLLTRGTTRPTDPQNCPACECKTLVVTGLPFLDFRQS